MGEFYFCCVRLTKCCSQVIFSFFGDLLSMPHFPLLCCRPESNTDRPNPACTTVWTKDILSKRKGIYFFERVLFIPSEASRECLTCFLNFFSLKQKKKTLFVNSNFKLIKYQLCHCLLT